MDLNNELVSDHESYLDVNKLEISLNSQSQKHAQSDSLNILIRSIKSIISNINNNDWLEKSIDNEDIKLYEYSDFKNIQSIKKGSFGSIVRATLNNIDDLFALKSFNNDEATLCEIVREIKLHQFIAHENIIQFYGITKMENVDQMNMNKYILVFEYADNDKTSNVYSFGILLWQISSGYRPFRDEGYNVKLILDILSGKREKIIDGTPEEYSKLYAECWNYDSQKRPNMQQVVSTLNQLKSSNNFQDNNPKSYVVWVLAKTLRQKNIYLSCNMPMRPAF
ncbi:unnamed protein product [Rhizophagus irregularis]|uniref:Protein kinase domain-containing protein n=1 Tax=Rhizophagus irregularis TaxID=588596 RepID=A0A915YVA3_9GLOM|nr:unnamed protein product [Rhizophagus irregularis]